MPSAPQPSDPDTERVLRERLREDPNDVSSFALLAEVVRENTARGHPGANPQRAADDAIWALAEELAHSGRAWYPLVELARLSIEDDREAAMRRLGTAAERDHTGQALAMGLLMLRQAGHPGDALNLGVGHWRPAEHDVAAGRQLVEAAVEAARYPEARRHLEALGQHPDRGAVDALLPELDRLVTAAERRRTVDVREQRTPAPPTPASGLTLDLRDRDLREGMLSRARPAPRLTPPPRSPGPLRRLRDFLRG